MVGSVKKAFPACVRSVKRGDVYYADFGSVEDAVGHELAKKRPVLIIQNNLGNKKSTTTICLCLSSKCKYGLPYHVHFGPMSRLWTQKVELFSPYLIARRDVSYAARASSSTCCGVL